MGINNVAITGGDVMGSGALLLVAIVVVMLLWSGTRNREIIVDAHQKGVPIYFNEDGEFRQVEKIYTKHNGKWEQV